MLGKSYEEYVLGLYGSMLLDIEVNRPELQADSRRDYKRLLSLVEHRGLPFFLVDLPAFGKHFDLCLSTGHLTKSGVAGFGSYRSRGPIPKLFKGLVLRVFDDFGKIRIDPDVYSVRAVRQLCSAVKKLVLECPDSSTWKHVNEFFQIEGEIVQPSLNWDVGDFDPDDSTDLHLGDHFDHRADCVEFNLSSQSTISTYLCDPARLRTIQSVADACIAKVGRFNPFDWRFRHGPGAVSDLRSGKYKYLFPSWPEKLEQFFPLADFAFANYADWAESVRSGGEFEVLSRNEPPARLHAVPKTFSGPRLIAAEPTAHQWCQQSILSFLMSRVEDSPLGRCISFRDQQPNRDFALLASSTGAHATIDLSSASDRISCWLVERIFRRSPSLLSAFYASRTRWMVQDIDKLSPRFHRLRKFSTMGSAVTFPVQSIIFAIIAIGNVLHSEELPVNYDTIRHAARRVRVFGDDIIVPSHVFKDVVESLSYLRLKVNPTKTFSEGNFRESCGMDAFNGNDVSKTSITRIPSVSKPEAVLSSVDAHNNLYSKGWFEAAKFVKRTVESLKRYAFATKHPSSGAIGWSDAFGEYHSPLLTRWNPHLHRKEIRVTLPKGGGARLPVDSSTMTLQYFTEALKPPLSSEERLGVASLRDPLKLRWTWAPVP